jgi:hypothetical protein
MGYLPVSEDEAYSPHGSFHTEKREYLVSVDLETAYFQPNPHVRMCIMDPKSLRNGTSSPLPNHTQIYSSSGPSEDVWIHITYSYIEMLH